MTATIAPHFARTYFPKGREAMCATHGPNAWHSDRLGCIACMMQGTVTHDLWCPLCFDYFREQHSTHHLCRDICLNQYASLVRECLSCKEAGG